MKLPYTERAKYDYHSVLEPANSPYIEDQADRA
jgi:hypothetical protein